MGTGIDIHTSTAPPNIVNLFQHISTVRAYNITSSSNNSMYMKKSNLEKLRQADSIFGAKL